MKRALVWFRRDLRVSDQSALAAARGEADEIVPLFILDPGILEAKRTGSRRVAFLLGCLDSLAGNISHLGGRLILRQGQPDQVIKEICQEIHIESVHWNRDYEAYARKRDKKVQTVLQNLGVRVEQHEDLCLCAPGTVLKQDGNPYTVFTPFSRQWKQVFQDIPRPRPQSIKTPRSIWSMDLPAAEHLGHSIDIDIPDTGEKAALGRLKEFINNHLSTYDTERDYPAIDGTSRLSPDLKFGSIGPRLVYSEVFNERKKGGSIAQGADAYLNELIWRDFYKHILHFFPHVENGAFRKKYDNLEWENNRDYFEAWCRGETGYPIVDAAMRQLNQTGWMHNRLRMIVASFLTKDLLVDWRWGERYFMEQLLDGDIAANNGGWQWAAGTGTDAQPYFRIFNPFSQAKKFDPEGRFIERFVGDIHASDYQPIVDHKAQREKALALYKAV